MYKKILLIDDDEDEQFFFMEALKEVNAQVKFFFASSSKEGIRMLDFLCPDVVFIDMNMPVMNGLECLEEISRNRNVKPTDTIIYSTGINDDLCDRALKIGASACVKKQGNIHDLADMLKDFLSRQ